jgi:hypothetical protein
VEIKFSIFAQIRFSALSISAAFSNEEDRLKKIAFSGEISRPNFA